MSLEIEAEELDPPITVTRTFSDIPGTPSKLIKRHKTLPSALDEHDNINLTLLSPKAGHDYDKDNEDSEDSNSDNERYGSVLDDLLALFYSTMGPTFILGGIAGITSKTLIAPFDRVKIVFQTTNRSFSFRHMFSLMYEIVARNGIFSLWRGHSLTLLRTFPYAGTQFMAFDIYKKLLSISPKNDESHASDNLTPWRRFLAGSLAGTTASVAVYPLELLRSRMAVQRIYGGHNISYGHHPKLAQQHHANFIASQVGLFGNLRNIIEIYGYRGLYLGLKPTLLGMIPYAGLAFGSFETMKVMILQHYHQKDLLNQQRVVIGAVSGLMAQSLTYPLDIVRRRMQTDGAHQLGEIYVDEVGKPKKFQPKYTGVIQTMQLVVKEEGMRGLYKGVSLNWFKGPIALGISFSTFDALKTILDNYEHQHN